MNEDMKNDESLHRMSENDVVNTRQANKDVVNLDTPIRPKQKTYRSEYSLLPLPPRFS